MNRKILLVDDEPAILDGLRRQLRKKWKELDTAVGGEAGLKAVAENGPYAVVMSDMLMPGMNGSEFLAQVRNICPNSVRLILSGHSDLDLAIQAVNQGHIFRFLTKPCPTDSLISTLESALEQHRLLTAEKSLLENTLSGAIKMLTEVLSMVNPAAFSSASRMKTYAEEIAGTLGLEDAWQFGVAALLSQVGCITLPTDTLGKMLAGQELSEEEEAMYKEHPAVAEKLLSNIPRLEPVARMVAGQMMAWDDEIARRPFETWPPDRQGAQILRTVIAYDRLIAGGEHRKKAIERLANSQESHPEQILNILKSLEIQTGERSVRTVGIHDLRVGMITDQEVHTCTDILLVPKGQEISFPLLKRLHNFAEGVGIVQPIRVLVPH